MARFAPGVKALGGVALLVTAVFSVFLWRSSSNPVSTPAPDTSVQNDISINPNVDTNEIPHSFPTIQIDVFDIAEQEDDGCEIVPGFLTDDQGNSVEVVQCLPEIGVERHAYADYRDDVLHEMAYRDAEAARELGFRWVARASINDFKMKIRGVQYYLRSAALSGDVEVINRAASQAFSRVATGEKPAAMDIVSAFVLREVAARLAGGTNAWQSLFDDLDLPAQQQRNIETKVASILRHLAQIQSEVTGRTTFREAMGDE